MRCVCQSKMNSVILAPGDYNYIFGLGAGGDGLVCLGDPDKVSNQCRALFGFGPRKLSPEEKMVRRSRLKWEKKQKQRAAEKQRKMREAARAATRERNARKPGQSYSVWAREYGAAYKAKQESRREDAEL